MLTRFLMGLVSGGLVGTGVLALLSLSLSGVAPQAPQSAPDLAAGEVAQPSDMVAVDPELDPKPPLADAAVQSPAHVEHPEAAQSPAVDAGTGPDAGEGKVTSVEVAEPQGDSGKDVTAEAGGASEALTELVILPSPDMADKASISEDGSDTQPALGNAQSPQGQAAAVPEADLSPLQPSPDGAAAAVSGDLSPLGGRNLATGGGSTFTPENDQHLGQNIQTNRLPQIAAPIENAGPEVALAVDGAALPPTLKYARPFTNVASKPLFSIILFDDGSTAIDRSKLAALPFPITFALDPSQSNVAEATAIYRAADQEVVIWASAVQKDLMPSDVAASLDAMAHALPESVAIMDVPSRSFQSDRTLSAAVVPALAQQGRGLVTWNMGLNAADQVAKREDVPSVVIFRDLDGEGESASTVRRYLDRAAFKAAQDGYVTVFGRLSNASTLEALLEWSLEGRSANVTLAPVSAMLQVD